MHFVSQSLVWDSKHVAVVVSVLTVLKWGYFFLFFLFSLDSRSFQTCMDCGIFLFQVQHVENDSARDPHFVG